MQLERLAAAADVAQARVRSRLVGSVEAVSGGVASTTDAASSAASDEEAASLRASIRELREVVASMHNSKQVRYLKYLKPEE